MTTAITDVLEKWSITAATSCRVCGTESSADAWEMATGSCRMVVKISSSVCGSSPLYMRCSERKGLAIAGVYGFKKYTIAESGICVALCARRVGISVRFIDENAPSTINANQAQSQLPSSFHFALPRSLANQICRGAIPRVLVAYR